MLNRQIITIGEALLDIIFKNDKPLRAVAGGSMLNTSLSLGRVGLNVKFISELGSDHLGSNILKFLEKNNVNKSHIFIYREGKTALALAFLDNEDNASYDFYKLYPRKRLEGEFPIVSYDDLILFGSFFALNQSVRDKLVKFIKRAKESGAIITYDPNIRKSSEGNIRKVLPLIMENIELADIIRGSAEDFETIFNSASATDIYKRIGIPGKYLVVTNGRKAIQFKSDSVETSLEVPKITTMSTIGAGDNFNAGLIYSLNKNSISKKNLEAVTKSEWIDMLKTGLAFAGEVCKSYENYISLEFAQKYKMIY